MSSLREKVEELERRISKLERETVEKQTAMPVGPIVLKRENGVMLIENEVVSPTTPRYTVVDINGARHNYKREKQAEKVFRTLASRVKTP